MTQRRARKVEGEREQWKVCTFILKECPMCAILVKLLLLSATSLLPYFTPYTFYFQSSIKLLFVHIKLFYFIICVYGGVVQARISVWEKAYRFKASANRNVFLFHIKYDSSSCKNYYFSLHSHYHLRSCSWWGRSGGFMKNFLYAP